MEENKFDLSELLETHRPIVEIARSFPAPSQATRCLGRFRMQIGLPCFDSVSFERMKTRE